MPKYPKHTGGGWYELSNGEKVQGKDEASKAEAALSSDKGRKSKGLSAVERAALRERSQEIKAEASGDSPGERDLLAKLAEMTETDRAMGERIHAIIRAVAPDLTPKTWYGMPAYAKNGKIICFFQPADKFDSRYATLGFNDAANLDKGAMWPTSYALTELTATEEARIGELVKKAAS